MSRKPCGTTAAYQRHLRNGEEPCAECRRAWRKYHAEHRAKNPDRREREYAYNAAYDRALRRLVVAYSEAFNALLAEERAKS